MLQSGQHVRMRSVKRAVLDEEFAAVLLPLPDRFIEVYLVGQLCSDSRVHQGTLAGMKIASTIKPNAVASEFAAARVPESQPDAPVARAGKLVPPEQMARA